jgi:hypothetical protein
MVMKVLHRPDLPKIEVSPEMLWRLLGHPNPDKVAPALQKTFEQVMEIGPGLIEPAAGYHIFPIKGITPSSVQVDSVSFESQDLARHFQGAKEIAIFVSTIGLPLEEKVEKLFAENNPGLGFFLDIFGSAAVEVVAYQVREIIDGEVQARGYRAMTHGYCIGKTCPAYVDCGGCVTCWWSPGYGDLKTAEQKNLFSLIDGSQIGVHLSESCMMTPRKSYACLMPIGPQEGKSPNPCDEGEKEWITMGSLAPGKSS